MPDRRKIIDTKPEKINVEIIYQYDFNNHKWIEIEEYTDKKGNVKINRGTRRVKFVTIEGNYAYCLVNENTKNIILDNLNVGLFGKDSKLWSFRSLYMQFKAKCSNKLKLYMKSIQDFAQYIDDAEKVVLQEIRLEEDFSLKWYGKLNNRR